MADLTEDQKAARKEIKGDEEGTCLAMDVILDNSSVSQKTWNRRYKWAREMDAKYKVFLGGDGEWLIDRLRPHEVMQTRRSFWLLRRLMDPEDWKKAMSMIDAHKMKKVKELKVDWEAMKNEDKKYDMTFA